MPTTTSRKEIVGVGWFSVDCTYKVLVEEQNIEPSNEMFSKILTFRKKWAPGTWKLQVRKAKRQWEEEYRDAKKEN